MCWLACSGTLLLGGAIAAIRYGNEELESGGLQFSLLLFLTCMQEYAVLVRKLV